jgi:hypothetical protein
MVNRSIILAVVIAAILAASGAYYFSSVSGGSSNQEIIDMRVTSGTPQNGAPDAFLPANFTVTQGAHVTLVFDNTDDGPHEFEIPALGVTTGIVQGGQTVRVNFVPTQVGTFASDQPPGACNYGGLTYNQGGCTGQQFTNGFVTVVPPSR